MIRKGECRDNACAESFFATLKRELEGLDGRHSSAQVRRSVFMYVETYYCFEEEGKGFIWMNIACPLAVLEKTLEQLTAALD